MYICNTNRSIELRDTGAHFDRKEPLVSVGAYCLMPNHFHILITENTEGGISKYMLKLMTAYTMYFNKKYERSGKLCEGTFKSQYVNSDRYMKYLYSYIHMNPAKLKDKNWKTNTRKNPKELLEFVYTYPYSSMTEYKERSFNILDPLPFPVYFKNINEHKKELFGWLKLLKLDN